MFILDRRKFRQWIENSGKSVYSLLENSNFQRLELLRWLRGRKITKATRERLESEVGLPAYVFRPVGNPEGALYVREIPESDEVAFYVAHYTRDERQSDNPLGWVAGVLGSMMFTLALGGAL